MLKTEKYIASIKLQIREQQEVQMADPPLSEVWQNASVEINRLAAWILAGMKDSAPPIAACD